MPFVSLSVVAHVLFGAFLIAVFSWVAAPPRRSMETRAHQGVAGAPGKEARREAAAAQRRRAAPSRLPKAAPDQSLLRLTRPSPCRRRTRRSSRRRTRRKPAKDTKKSLFDAFNKTGRAASQEAPEGDEAGDKDGDSAKQEGERYYGLLSAVVKRNYDVSDTIPEAERRTLKATVMMKLGATGELLDVDLSKPSGNELFDSAVLGAIKKAAPFGPPPEHLRDTLKKNGVALVFSP